MNSNKPNIILYSDSTNTSSITSLIASADFSEGELKISRSFNFESKPEDILIFYLTKANSAMIDKLINEREYIRNTKLFIIPPNLSMLGLNLLKNKFENIFVTPDENKELLEFINQTMNDYVLRSKSNFTFIDRRDYVFSSILGNSAHAVKMIDLAKKVAKSQNVNILIMGETGTGKGVLARAIHDYGNLKGTPFVDIVCTAIPETLLESELFGYEKGAFTGAVESKQGLFEISENGTLFLDEIGDLSLTLQAKLLRVVEKKVVRRIGGVSDIPIKTRIISATNKDLHLAVEKKEFRSDLFFRLNALTLQIPPLRDRDNDILHLTEHFILDACNRLEKQIWKIERELLVYLINYTWPGNIRELKNAIERAVVLADDKVLKLSYFDNFQLLSEPRKKYFINMPLSEDTIRLDVKYQQTDLENLTKQYANEVFKKMGKNKSKTAEKLRVTRPTLNKLLS